MDFVVLKVFGLRIFQKFNFERFELEHFKIIISPESIKNNSKSNEWYKS